ncbi:MAG: hypothetical protein WCL32_13010 [Planctomycetota bacterium]
MKKYFWLFLCASALTLQLSGSASAQPDKKDPVEPPKLKQVEPPKKEDVKAPEVKAPEKAVEKAVEKAPEKAPAPVPEAKAPVEEKKAEEKKDEAKAPEKTAVEIADAKASDGQQRGDIAWMLVSTAFVMLMVPGLALFYGGMVRRKNVLATMMQSMICLSVVGVFWIGIGYSLAFGDPWIKIGGLSVLGWSPELVFLRGVRPDTIVPNLTIPVYLHMAYQGMFAIITPALISGALAERIKFRSYLTFILIWMVVIYCPLAQSVWAMNWNWTLTLAADPYAYANSVELADAKKAVEDAAEAKKADPKLDKALAAIEAKIAASDKKIEEFKSKYIETAVAAETSEKDKKARQDYYTGDTGKKMTGYFGGKDVLDFAGGTVVHIAAGLSSLAAFLALRKRFGYPEHAFHPNSMVLTLTGAGILWFGWFGFNGGSGLASGTLAVSAFTATQAAAAAAGLVWSLVEWVHRGKPTALGFASGVVAGLVAVTPAAGYIVPWAGLAIGLVAGFVCYISVFAKSIFKYDDSLDAFGVHGVGGFLGAVLTGFLCWKPVNSVAIVNDGFFYGGGMTQVGLQLWAASISAIGAFVVSFILVKIIDMVMGFTVTAAEETTGLDQVEHGETGFDFGLAHEAAAVGYEPKSARIPPDSKKRFSVVVDGLPADKIATIWGDLCQPNKKPSPDFLAVYPKMTLLAGNKFKFIDGNPEQISAHLAKVLQASASGGAVRTTVEK